MLVFCMYVGLPLPALALRCLAGSGGLSFLDKYRFHFFSVALSLRDRDRPDRVLSERLLLLSRGLLVRVRSHSEVCAFFILYPWLFYHLVLIGVLALARLCHFVFCHEANCSLLFWLSFLILSGRDRFVLLLYIVMVAVVAYRGKNAELTGLR